MDVLYVGLTLALAVFTYALIRLADRLSQRERDER